MPIVNPSSRTPIIFTQADTEDLAFEIREVRRMKYPLDRTARLQAIHSLKSFAIEWSVRFEDFEPYNYFTSIEKFEKIKGDILKKMHGELKLRSERDAANMKSFLSGFSFDEEMFGEPKFLDDEKKKASRKSSI